MGSRRSLVRWHKTPVTNSVVLGMAKGGPRQSSLLHQQIRSTHHLRPQIDGHSFTLARTRSICRQDHPGHTSIAIWCDNLPAVSWIYKMRTSTSPIASRILRALAVRLQHNHTSLLGIDHISGIYNIIVRDSIQIGSRVRFLWYASCHEQMAF
jgi:hypothetical protein